MTQAQDAPPVLLTVRGTLVPPDLESARALHNATAGSPEGIAGARALGDLSHKVYAPLENPLSRATKGELLFIDTWLAPEGIMKFFSNPQIAASARQMFSKRAPTVWMPAVGAFHWSLPAAMGQDRRYIGMIQGPIASPEAAVAIFSKSIRTGLVDARRRGQMAHDVYVKLPMPGDDSPPELLGVALWSSLEGLLEHYGDPSERSSLAGVFSGPAEPTVWEQSPGHWNEW